MCIFYTDLYLIKNLPLIYICFLVLLQVLELYSNVGMIPKFNNLSRLEAMFPCDSLHFLPAFLECCPNLKHLILVQNSQLKTVGFCLYYNCKLSLFVCVSRRFIIQLRRRMYTNSQMCQGASYRPSSVFS